jgi:hypothetical protein
VSALHGTPREEDGRRRAYLAFGADFSADFSLKFGRAPTLVTPIALSYLLHEVRDADVESEPNARPISKMLLADLDLTWTLLTLRRFLEGHGQFAHVVHHPLHPYLSCTFLLPIGICPELALIALGW